MKNLPLAVRLFTFQLLACRSVEEAFCFLSTPSFHHDQNVKEAKSADRIHTRGFHYVVQFALQVISERRVQGANLMCFAFSLLPFNGVSFGFLHLLGYHFKLNQIESNKAIELLTEVGIVCRTGKARVGMHQLVQRQVRFQTLEMDVRRTVARCLCNLLRLKTIDSERIVVWDLKVLETMHTCSPSQHLKDRDYQIYLERVQSLSVLHEIQAVIFTLIGYLSNEGCEFELREVLICYECCRWCCREQDQTMNVKMLNAKIQELRKKISPFSNDNLGVKDFNESFIAGELRVVEAKMYTADGITIQRALYCQAPLMSRAYAFADLFCRTFSAREGLILFDLENLLIITDRICEAESVMSFFINICRQKEDKVPVGCYKELSTESRRCLSYLVHAFKYSSFKPDSRFLRQVILWAEASYFFLQGCSSHFRTSGLLRILQLLLHALNCVSKSKCEMWLGSSRFLDSYTKR